MRKNGAPLFGFVSEHLLYLLLKMFAHREKGLFSSSNKRENTHKDNEKENEKEKESERGKEMRS